MTMVLRCVHRYYGGRFRCDPGMVLHLSDSEGRWLLRDSPESFTIVDTAAEPEPEKTGAMSTLTAGDFIPDRRARGGRKRTTASG